MNIIQIIQNSFNIIFIPLLYGHRYVLGVKCILFKRKHNNIVTLYIHTSRTHNKFHSYNTVIYKSHNAFKLLVVSCTLKTI